jgi:hypothetical protein
VGTSGAGRGASGRGEEKTDSAKAKIKAATHMVTGRPEPHHGCHRSRSFAHRSSGREHTPQESIAATLRFELGVEAKISDAGFAVRWPTG